MFYFDCLMIKGKKYLNTEMLLFLDYYNTWMLVLFTI